MEEPLDLWPVNLDGVEFVTTLKSADGRKRVRIWRRGDGLYQFLPQRLDQDEEQGKTYLIWRPFERESGLYGDLLSAERDASRLMGD